MSTEAFLHMSPLSELPFAISSSSLTCNSLLHLKNTHSSRVSFKIKTTAPDAYLVRPTLGVLEPSQSQTVVVTLRTQQADNLAKHKFSIQSRETTLDPSDTQAITALWASAASTGVQQVVLRAVVSDEPKTPVSASSVSTAPPTFTRSETMESETRTQTAELVKSNVAFTQQTLQVEKLSLEARLKTLRSQYETQATSSSFTSFQLLLVLLLGLVLGTALFS